MTIQSYRDLRVWQTAMNLVEQIYRFTETFPKHELYGLTNQIRRSAVSVPSNLAEGHTRESRKEFLQFLSVAQGSLAELETQLEIARRLKYLSAESWEQFVAEGTSLRRQLYALRNSLLRSPKPTHRSQPPSSVPHPPIPIPPPSHDCPL